MLLERQVDLAHYTLMKAGPHKAQVEWATHGEGSSLRLVVSVRRGHLEKVVLESDWKVKEGNVCAVWPAIERGCPRGPVGVERKSGTTGVRIVTREAALHPR